MVCRNLKKQVRKKKISKIKKQEKYLPFSVLPDCNGPAMVRLSVFKFLSTAPGVGPENDNALDDPEV